MTKEQQTKHRINVRAYFLGEKRQKAGNPADPDADWLAAEWEERRLDEPYDLYLLFPNGPSRDDKVPFSVLRQVSNHALIRVVDITYETLLLTDRKVREALGRSASWDLTGDFKMTDNVKTVGDLIAEIRKSPPIVPKKPTAYW